MSKRIRRLLPTVFLFLFPQMYTALKKRRVPAKFIRYPDSYHGGWTPWNMVHRYYNELGWWKEYLLPEPTKRGTSR